MPYCDHNDAFDDDEDCYDDEDDPDDADAAPCPDCGAPVYSFSDACPKCGYWLSDADRRAMRPGESKPAWVTITAAILLTVFLLGLLTFFV